LQGFTSGRRTVAGVSPRATVLAVVLAALLGSGIGASAVALVVKRGPEGTRGASGPRGPRGPEGSTEVDASEVQAAIDDDPDTVATSLSGHLDYQDIQQNLDPDPADLESELQDVSDKLDRLCSDLSFSAAVENDITAC
jgi:hypothetical protein